MSNSYLNRSYGVSDSVMIQESRVKRALFIDDKELFAGFDQDFADPFADNWNSAIESAAMSIDDSYRVGELRESTETVYALIDKADSLIKDLKYYLEKAYPDSKSVFKRFGIHGYRKSHFSQEKMVKLLKLAYKSCVKDPDKLISAGFDTKKINRLSSLSDELAEADMQQEMIKDTRPELTAERIKVFNDCYAYMKKVNKAARRIFEDNKTKYNQYKLPYGSVNRVAEPQPES